MAGRLPHWLFRGLLEVHSRCYPHGLLTSEKKLFLEVLHDIHRLLTRPECFQLERELMARIRTGEENAPYQGTHNNTAERAVRVVALGRKNSHDRQLCQARIPLRT